jgi:primosomal protein N' (replication factor Y)
MERIFRRRFGDRLAVWHSAVSDRERRRQWADLLDCKRSVVLGARSAVLTPVSNLGLIIIDEEHDGSYKQEDRLRYNARDVALVRGKISNIPVVMGSATPSLSSVYRGAQEQFRSLLLPTRVKDRPHPEFEVVDMKREGPRAGMFSARLRACITETLAKGQQALLFLNRRGYAKYFLCNSCGHALQCVSCSVTLTYHKQDDCLRCHFCGWETKLPERCPECGHAALFSHGFGTEKVEKEVKRLFPDAHVVRMDRDTMNKGEKLEEALNCVRSGKADILLGTQMVAKGHDFPNITLVGIINADSGLQVPDFRAGEILVQLLIQVAGRAGRGDEPGRVILQTFNPFHFTIESALRMDYNGFCDRELESRKILQYPPFTRLLKMLVTSPREDAACTGARFLAALCREKAEALKSSGRHVAVLGPSPAAYVKLKNRFRWQVFIKTWTSSDMQHFVESVLEATRNDPAFRGVMITVDRDPTNEI